MKRIIALFLIFCTIFPLISCSRIDIPEETAETKEEKLEILDGSILVGFSRKAYTPIQPAPMGGYGNAEYRLSGEILDDVQATCLAFKDQKGNTALLFTLDLISILASTCNRLRERINKDLGIPKENMFFACTHTHSAPTVISDSEAGESWRQLIFDTAVVAAAKEAVSDLSPADIYASETVAENMNFIRRYMDEDGTFLGTNTIGNSKNPSYETEADRSMRIIKFFRGDKTPILLANFAAHPCYDSGEKKTTVSANYIHYFRTSIESEGYHCAFFQGAAGNLITSTLIQKDKKYVYSTSRKYGQKLASFAKNALDDMELLSAGEIRTVWEDFSVDIDHTRDSEKDKAKIVYDILNAGKMDEANKKAKEFGFADAYDARDVYEKSQMKISESMPISAMQIGEIGFVFPPYEMFDTNGRQVLDNADTKMTFICELSNHSLSYIPSEYANSHGGYEINSCNYAPGTGEKIAEELTKLLNSLK